VSKLVFPLLLDHADQLIEPKHNYSDNVRQQVYQALLMRSKNGRLGKKDTSIVSEQFGVKIRTVQRIWKRGKNQLAQNIPVKVPNLKKGRSGRKAVPVDLENLRNIPLQQRMTLEDVSSRLGISKTRLHNYLKKVCLGTILVVSNLITSPFSSTEIFFRFIHCTICRGLIRFFRHVRLAYQSSASSTFLSQQTSHKQPASSTLLSEQTSTSHQPPANRTGCFFFYGDIFFV
jgi:AraC-like DNA-binding protein